MGPDRIQTAQRDADDARDGSEVSAGMRLSQDLAFTRMTVIACSRATAPLVIAALFTASARGWAQPGAAANAAAIAAEPAVASYVSSRINSKPPPMTDRATDDSGVQYLIEFDELILSIRGNHEFRAALRFRQTLAAKGGHLSRDPIQKMTVYGTWSVGAGELRFVPDPKRGGSGLRILSGTFGGNHIDVPIDYRNGTVSRRANVVLVKNAHIF